MKAIQITQTGGPEALTLADLPIPTPKSGEVLVKIHASGVNFIDIYYREGRYKTQLPFIDGQEAAGIDEECYLVDPASSHMLVSKIKPCMCKYELIQTVKLRMAH